jgi:hypothetical protein
MMHGPEKSDPGTVAMKPANKTEQSVAEPVERRWDQGECGPAKHVPDGGSTVDMRGVTFSAASDR